jgi:hypothetical protein
MEGVKNRVESFLRELGALCAKHSVSLFATEDDGIGIVSSVEDDERHRTLAFFHQREDRTDCTLAATDSTYNYAYPGGERFTVSYSAEEVESDVCIQWKGTHVCCDFHCKCGHYAHICNVMFMYTIRCHKCGVRWDVPDRLPLRPAPNQSAAEDVSGVDTGSFADEE